jgi:hypothetical protein
LELAQERGDAGQIIQSLLCWYADDETRSSVGRPTEQEPPESSLIKRLANWVFDQHPDQGAPQTKATLLKIAITRGIGDWDTSQFDEAYRLVYETKRGAPPITGWSLREPYKTRFVERKNRG